MGIIKNTLQKQIQANNKQQFNDTTATIIEYNTTLNTAKIRFPNPNGEGYLYRDNVSVSNTLGGVTGAGIYPGQSCTVTFMGNNVYAPIITGLIGSNYANKTCSDQGAYLVDSSALLYDKPSDLVPMTSNWIEENNTNSIKYNNDLGDYTSTDAAVSIHETLNSLDKYKATEQGITSLDTKSTVKFKDNGDIDMFVSNNIGIRICPGNKTIEFYGMKFLFNGTDIENYRVQEATGNHGNNTSQVESIKISDIIKVSEIQELFKTIDDTIQELKLCIQYTISITGNASKFNSLTNAIQGYENLKVQYYDNIDNLTSEFVSETYDKLLQYNQQFNKELSDASNVLGGI